MMYTQKIANNHPEQGSILVYFALFLVVILGFGAIALDGSNAYVQQRRMQNAADAAALAGARMAALGGSSSLIQNEINQFATINGAQEVSWQFTQSGKAIEVQAEETFDTAFAKLFGMNTMTARAVSEAAYGVAASADNMLPMTAPCTERTPGETYTLWEKESGGMGHGDDDDHDSDGQGNFGWLDWNGGSPSTPELADNILHPSNSGYWHIGDSVPSAPGVKGSSQVISALNTWMGHHVTIPLYSSISGNGNNATYQICGFAEFVLTGFNFHGCHKWIEGYFIQTIKTDGEVGDDDDVDYGISILYISK